MNDKELHKRLARMESRIVQIMLALNIDPYERMYAGFENSKHSTTTEFDTQSQSASERHKRSKLERCNRLSSLSACSPF